jgi:hypothetical protein
MVAANPFGMVPDPECADPRLLDALIGLSADSDPDTRWYATVALADEYPGDGPALREALASRLSDPDEQVSSVAKAGLARRRDRRGGGDSGDISAPSHDPRCRPSTDQASVASWRPVRLHPAARYPESSSRGQRDRPCSSAFSVGDGKAEYRPQDQHEPAPHSRHRRGPRRLAEPRRLVFR